MNREIKFKVWHPEHGMSGPFTIQQLCDLEFLESSGFGKDFSPDSVFLQFTGYEDKFGTEVYEGDKWAIHNLRGIIAMHEGKWTIKWGNDSVGDLHAHIITKAGEVIGSSY